MMGRTSGSGRRQVSRVPFSRCLFRMDFRESDLNSGLEWIAAAKSINMRQGGGTTLSALTSQYGMGKLWSFSDLF